MEQLDALLARLKQLPDYELRPGQIEMARAVADAIDEGHHLLVEAGTGTGKTFAYLLPALSRGVRTIVSTSTKALQEQLYNKDLPELERVVGRPIHYAILKGRRNYACLYQIEQIRGGNGKELFESKEQVEQLHRLLDWIAAEECGDLEQYPEQLDGQVHEAVTMDSDGCAGRDCPFFERCYLMLARAEALEAEVVVVNHALLIQDLLIRHASDGALSLLSPEAQLVIIDEAHRLEEAALGALGVTLSAHRLHYIQRKAARLSGLRSATRRLFEELGRKAIDFEQLLKQVLGETAQAKAPMSLTPVLVGLELFLGDLQEELRRDLKEATELLPPASKQELTVRYEMVQRPLRRLAEDVLRVRVALEQSDPNYITYVERRRKSYALLSYPLDVSQTLREILFGAFPSVICTSATLAIPVRGEVDRFGYTRRRLGAESARGLVVSSPFDYRSQALIYLPETPDLLDPSRADNGNRELYEQALEEEVRRLVKASRGRALVLTTSVYMMRRLADALQDCGYPVFRQGQAPRAELVAALRREPSVLVATRSFWEGVDVRGEAVSLVVIDRLPFPGREDIFWQARYDRAGTRWFELEALPQALLTLKQGFGRLIRSRTDRGVVALLDGRLLTRSYGRFFLGALPDCLQTRSLRDVEDFLNGAGGRLHRPVRSVFFGNRMDLI